MQTSKSLGSLPLPPLEGPGTPAKRSKKQGFEDHQRVRKAFDKTIGLILADAIIERPENLRQYFIEKLTEDNVTKPKVGIDPASILIDEENDQLKAENEKLSNKIKEQEAELIKLRKLLKRHMPKPFFFNQAFVFVKPAAATDAGRYLLLNSSHCLCDAALQLYGHFGHQLTDSTPNNNVANNFPTEILCSCVPGEGRSCGGGHLRRRRGRPRLPGHRRRKAHRHALRRDRAEGDGAQAARAVAHGQGEGTRCVVHGVWCMVRGAWCTVKGALAFMCQQARGQVSIYVFLVKQSSSRCDI
jgi:hypothetical protein